MQIYARCLYFAKGCSRYRITVNIDENSIHAVIYSTSSSIHHKSNYKNVQLRAIRRKIVKSEIKNEKATNWRNRKLSKQNKHLRRQGNLQEIPTPNAVRKIKSEQLGSCNRDKDIFIDLYKMRQDKTWDRYIQHISMPQEIYLFMKKQLTLLYSNKRKVLRFSRNTLFFDATGSVVKKLDDESKRSFLNSLVAR